jgi:AbrB family looped-hinge helix DNA binding protein
MWMKLFHSRITAQGQISIPAEVRRTLGVGPGAILEWESCDGGFVVRRATKATTLDVHRALFSESAPTSAKPVDTKAAIADYIRKRHAGR